MAGWPWPLDAVQSWFEGLWNHVSNIIWSGVQWVIDRAWEGYRWLSDRTSEMSWWLSDRLADTQFWLKDRVGEFISWLSDNIWGGINWLSDRLQNVGRWVIDTIYNGLVALSDGIGSIGQWVTDVVYSVADAVNIWVYDTSQWIVDVLYSGYDAIQLWLGNTGTWIINTLTEKIDAIQTAFEGFSLEGLLNIPQLIINAAIGFGQNLLQQLGGTLEEHSPAAWYYTSLTGTQLKLVPGWIFEGIHAVWDYIIKHLSSLADMVIGAITFIVDSVRGAIEGIVAWFTDGITGAIIEGSPPEVIGQASNVLVETSFDRQFNMIDAMYKSEPSGDDTILTATGLMGMLIAGGSVAMSMAIAADQVHPLKNMGWRPTVREIIYWAGIPSVTAAIAVLPASVGLLTPLRYALYERWQPIVPDAPDLIRFALREVFIEDERKRLLINMPEKPYFEYMAKQGYSTYWAENYWAAHWVRPTITQLTQMFYRGIIDREVWVREVRINDYVPYAIDWLEKIVHPPYTRVDLRRMWDMRTIDEPTMLREYKWLGYDDEHAAGMVLWTKVYTALPDLMARYRNGWISEHDVYAALVGLGLPESRAIELIQTKTKAVQGERLSGERDLTKTDLLKLLGIGEISDNQAKELLMSIGYDDVEAEYLVAIQLDRMTEELKDLTSAQILKSYRYEIFDRAETLTKLSDTGWSINAAETMLELEDIRLADTQVERARERDLSRTDIVRSMAREIIDTMTGYNYLAYLGYSQWEIQVIFSLEGLEWPTGA